MKIDNLSVEETSEADTELFSGEKEGAEGFGRLTLESILGDDSNQENIECYKRFI